MEFCEPYAKDKNLLQLSIFYFGKRRPVPTKTVTTWEDDHGSYKLTCVCKNGVPGSFEQDVYAAVMRIWVKQGMPSKGINLNYSDIARELGLKPRDYNKRVKQSLEKLAQARYEFKQCFVKADTDGNKRIDAHFSLFDTVLLFSHDKKRGDSKRGSQSRLIFSDLIQENLEAKYYQFLDMVWYRALSEGLPRRLYEYLAKRRYHGVNEVFAISEELLCRWLPIKDKHPTNRRKRLAKIAQELIDKGFLAGYTFDKNKKQCIFTYAENKVPNIPDTMQSIPNQNIAQRIDTPVSMEKGMITAFSPEDQQIYLQAQEWINSIPYLHEKRKHEIFSLPIAKLAQVYPEIRAEYERAAIGGDRPKPAWIYQRFMSHQHQEKIPVTPTAPPGNHEPMEFFVNDEVEPCQEPESDKSESLEVLLDLAREKQRRISQKLETIIKKYYEEQGYDYVRWNILYSNQTATKSYSVYLQKALASNWAEEWQEEQRADIDHKLELERQAKLEAEEEQRKKAEVEKAELQKPDFFKRVAELDYAIKKKLWDEADQSVPASNIRRETNVKIKYAEGLLRHLIGQDENFSPALLQRLDFGFINQVAEDFLKQIQD